MTYKVERAGADAPEHFRHAERAVERAEELLYYGFPSVPEGVVRALLDVARMRLDLATLQLVYAVHLETAHNDQ